MGHQSGACVLRIARAGETDARARGRRHPELAGEREHLGPVVTSQLRRVVDRRKITGRRTRPLHLGDHRDAGLSEPRLSKAKVEFLWQLASLKVAIRDLQHQEAPPAQGRASAEAVEICNQFAIS